METHLRDKADEVLEHCVWPLERHIFLQKIVKLVVDRSCIKHSVKGRRFKELNEKFGKWNSVQTKGPFPLNYHLMHLSGDWFDLQNILDSCSLCDKRERETWGKEVEIQLDSFPFLLLSSLFMTHSFLSWVYLSTESSVTWIGLEIDTTIICILIYTWQTNSFHSYNLEIFSIDSMNQKRYNFQWSCSNGLIVGLKLWINHRYLWFTVGWSGRLPRHDASNHSGLHNERISNRGTVNVHYWITCSHCNFWLWNLLFRGKILFQLHLYNHTP